jgi:hypothetical protein
MRLRLPTCVVAVWLICSSAAFAQSQTDQPLSRVLIDFLSASVRMSSGTTGPGNPHEAHYFPGLAQRVTPFELNKALISQLATFPIGSSSAGFTFFRDPTTGAVVPASRSFGPSFAERSLTVGRRKFSAGFNFQHTNFDSFEGQSLDDESIDFILRHNNCCVAGSNDPGNVTDLTPFFEGDLVETRLRLHLDTSTVSLFANYGVTDRLDVGIAVPIVSVDIRAAGTAEILRVSTGVPGPTDADPVNTHSWDGQGLRVRSVDETGGSKTGIGDILLRTKWNFLKTDAGGLAAGLEFRLPTGDEENLLGTGGTFTKLSFIGTMSRGAWEPRVNIGYTFASGELSAETTTIVVQRFGTSTNPGEEVLERLEPPPVDLSLSDEFNYVFGVDFAPTARVTFAADVVGRVLRDVTRFERTASSFDFRRSNTGPIETTTFDEMNIRENGNLNLALLAVGAKVNISRTLILSGNILFPLTDGGLKPKVTPVLGFDYVF